VEQHGVVVVGGGHNALVAAAYLSRSGMSVVVLDANDRVGGFVRTDEFMPGFFADRFSAVHSQFTSGPAYADLREDLQTHGLEYLNTEVPTGVSMVDGTTAVFPRDMHGLADEAERLASGDGAALRSMVEELMPYVPDMFSLFAQDLMSPSAITVANRLLRDETGLAFTPFATMLFETGREAMARFSSPALRSMLGSWVTHAGKGPDDSGGGIFTKLFTLLFLQAGLAIPRGGSGALATALERLVTAHGGLVRTNTDVTAIDVADGRATGVRTADGEAYQARRAVVASVNPDQLYTRLLAAADVPPSLRSQAGHYRYGRGQVQVNLALSQLPTWPDERFARIGQPFLTESLESLALHVTQANNGFLPANPTFSLAVPSSIDPSRAPARQAVMRIQITDVPTHVVGDAEGVIDARDGQWSKHVTDRFVDRVLGIAEHHIPGLTSTIIGRHVETPATLAAYNRNAGPGDPYGGALNLAQSFVLRPLPAQPSHRTFVPNLFMVGASTWPGSGISGASGYIVAQELLG